ncbi:hypothetical protein BO94DRAFT_234457 [Aspergillus sclerotioniger CBS 115572]|uniref:Uncharacterized protein n=1 Tax=Aspergillus sclerotioniger CBS 115572 TaxID=1450535 RepID=A0A317VLI1_9EURO|nr:hypothetical protein BO94DRAFT_234457 [Aspergillus sclerotioniger CBS 115572]PWY73798.1 hypothetical protein BO94DRAFT_234457 [Aspergillus sclerotioniger CBS 115572]
MSDISHVVTIAQLPSPPPPRLPPPPAPVQQSHKYYYYYLIASLAYLLIQPRGQCSSKICPAVLLRVSAPTLREVVQIQLLVPRSTRSKPLIVLWYTTTLRPSSLPPPPPPPQGHSHPPPPSHHYPRSYHRLPTLSPSIALPAPALSLAFQIWVYTKFLNSLSPLSRAFCVCWN